MMALLGPGPKLPWELKGKISHSNLPPSFPPLMYAGFKTVVKAEAFKFLHLPAHFPLKQLFPNFGHIRIPGG